jgi:hypothetical protein
MRGFNGVSFLQVSSGHARGRQIAGGNGVGCAVWLGEIWIDSAVGVVKIVVRPIVTLSMALRRFTLGSSGIFAVDEPDLELPTPALPPGRVTAFTTGSPFSWDRVQARLATRVKAGRTRARLRKPFAQFEREVTGGPTPEEIAASKKRGMRETMKNF